MYGLLRVALGGCIDQSHLACRLTSQLLLRSGHCAHYANAKLGHISEREAVENLTNNAMRQNSCETDDTPIQLTAADVIELVSGCNGWV